MKSLLLDLGAGISAHFTWPGDGTVRIEMKNPEGKVVGGATGPWTRPAILRASTRIRHACSLAVKSGKAPALGGGGFVHVSKASGAVRATDGGVHAPHAS